MSSIPALRISRVVSETSQNFRALLSRARLGDRSAIEELVKEYEPEVRLVARVRLGTALRPYLDSVDLVQSVHRSVLLGLRQDKFDISSPEKLVALALTIVRRKVARHWRRLRRQSRANVAESCSENLPELLLSLSSPELDPSDAVALRDQIERLFSRLDDTERRLMELRLEGFTTAEVARKLGLKSDVLRVRLSRLRRRLRDQGFMSDWL